MKASNPKLNEARISAILQIRLDGAEFWDVLSHVADAEAAGESPWELDGDPLDREAIALMIIEADELIAQSSPQDLPAVAIHKAKLRNLYARAVQAGDVATAARILKDVAVLENIYLQKGDKAPATGDNRLRLLREIQARHLAIANEKTTSCPRSHLEEWETQLEHGPVFKPLQWGGDDAGRMRLQRAMVELLDEGLVIETREPGARWAHVRLTEAGEAILETLARDAGGE